MQSPKSLYSQPVPDPVAYFKSIPWCSQLLTSKSVVQIVVPDRTPIPSTESAFVRETLNTSDTVNACVTCLKWIKPTTETKKNGETKEKPFLEMTAMLDLKSGVNGFAKTAHGGFYAVVLDEVMGTVANMQSDFGTYTAELTVKYKKPIFTPSVVLCKGRVVKREGRKVWAKGSFEDKDGSIYAEAEGLWIMMTKDIGRSNIPQSKL